MRYRQLSSRPEDPYHFEERFSLIRKVRERRKAGDAIKLARAERDRFDTGIKKRSVRSLAPLSSMLQHLEGKVHGSQPAVGADCFTYDWKKDPGACAYVEYRVTGSQPE